MQKSVEIAENAHEWAPEKRVVNVGVVQLGASVTGEMVDHARHALARLSVVINISGIGDWGEGKLTRTESIRPPRCGSKVGWHSQSAYLVLSVFPATEFTASMNVTFLDGILY